MSQNSERESIYAVRRKCLKPVYGSFSRDQSSRFPYLLWKKLVFTLKIEDHFFVNLNLCYLEMKLLICYVVYFPSICNGEQFGFMYEFNFLCFCLFVCLWKINVIIIIIIIIRLPLTRLTRCRMIWFLIPSPPPLHPRQLADGRGDVRGWARSQIIRPQEGLVLYKSFNTLCLRLYVADFWHIPRNCILLLNKTVSQIFYFLFSVPWYFI